MSQPQKQDCHTLQRVDLARPFLVSPAIKIEIENSREMALSKAKSGSAWQSHFWQCGTLRPARNTKLLHYASKSKLGFVQAASFNATVLANHFCVFLVVSVILVVLVATEHRRPDSSVGMALVLPALTDCRWWFEWSTRESQVRPAERRAPTTKNLVATVYKSLPVHILRPLI